MEFDDLHILMGMFHSKLLVSSSGSLPDPYRRLVSLNLERILANTTKKNTFFKGRFTICSTLWCALLWKSPWPSYGGVVRDRKIIKRNSGFSSKPCLIKVDLAESRIIAIIQGIGFDGIFLHSPFFFMGNLRISGQFFPKPNPLNHEVISNRG